MVRIEERYPNGDTWGHSVAEDNVDHFLFVMQQSNPARTYTILEGA